MPRVRRRGHTLRCELTPEQALCLLTGLGDGFSTHEDYARAWWAHRAELMAAVPLATRPDAWWALEFKGELPGLEDGRRVHDWEVLEKHGMLSPAEQYEVDKPFGLRAQRDRARIWQERSERKTA